MVILRRRDMAAATQEVLEAHGLQAEMSKDVRTHLDKAEKGEKKKKEAQALH